MAAKGGGSEAKSKFAMLNPSDSVVEWVLKTVPTMGAGWCPPGMLGIGIGGTAEKAMLLAKESLMDPIDIQELKARGAKTTAEKLRLELYEKVNRLGIGAQGLGGLTTVLDVKVLDYPAHAANLPVAMIPNCAATRHAHLPIRRRTGTGRSERTWRAFAKARSAIVHARGALEGLPSARRVQCRSLSASEARRAYELVRELRDKSGELARPLSELYRNERRTLFDILRRFDRMTTANGNKRRVSSILPIWVEERAVAFLERNAEARARLRDGSTTS